MKKRYDVKRFGKEENSTEACSEKLANFIHESGLKAFHRACGLSGNAEEAEELVQEASYRVMRSWRTYEALKPLDCYFFTIMRNVFLDSQRRFDRTHTVSLDVAVDGTHGIEYADMFCDGEDDLLHRLEREEIVETVRKALGALSEELQAVLRLCDMEGLQYEDIAQKLSIPVGTVRSRIGRARRLLREQLPQSATAAY